MTELKFLKIILCLIFIHTLLHNNILCTKTCIHDLGIHISVCMILRVFQDTDSPVLHCVGLYMPLLFRETTSLISRRGQTDPYKKKNGSWFQTFTVFWMFYAFLWVIPRLLNFICRRFRTPCLFQNVGI